MSCSQRCWRRRSRRCAWRTSHLKSLRALSVARSASRGEAVRSISPERKKCRAICFHLTTGALCTCVRGLGSTTFPGGISRAQSSSPHVLMPRLALGLQSLGLDAVTVVQRQRLPTVPKKRKLFECSIMEHLLSAKNTFKNDDSTADILICNYHGRHAPQQIDLIRRQSALEDFRLVCHGV